MTKRKMCVLFVLLFVSVGVFCFFVFDDIKGNTSVSSFSSDILLDNDDEYIDWSTFKKSFVVLDESSLFITEGGVYFVSGSVSNGNILVSTDDDVKIILDNVNITSNTGPAIIIDSANNTVIELADGSINYLRDGSDYVNVGFDGCIFSKDDLILQGNGNLHIVGSYSNGIVSNDDLKIVNGTYVINSRNDGIRGKDSVDIRNGNFNIKSGADGIKSTNDSDENKGYVKIDNGVFDIESEEDGIQAETKLIINDGLFDIDSMDDGIHSNNYIGIFDGIINIRASDDGVHADKDIIIENGEMKVFKSSEGIEASNVFINGGNLDIVSLDDGINISSGNDSPNQNNISSLMGSLVINDGTIYVDSSGDGLDSNGKIIINGGSVYVDGPTDNGNAPLDYDISFDINGGELIAVGSLGMVSNLSDTSKQYSMLFKLSKVYSDDIVLEDEEGNVIVKYVPKKEYQSVIISSNKLSMNNTYKLIIGGFEVDMITINSIINSSSYLFDDKE